MSRITAVFALVVGLATLVGCTSTGVSTPTPSPSVDSKQDDTALATITWEGGTQDPKLVFTAPLRVTQPTVRSIEVGTGANISMGQMVTFDTVVVNGETGLAEASTFNGNAPNQLILAQSTANTPMLSAMQAAKVGGKFLYVVPTDSSSSSSSDTSEATPAATASTVIGISIRSVEDVPAEAHGQAKAAKASMPKVTIGSDGKPTMVPIKGKAPSKLSSEVLIEGTGAQVGGGQTVAVKYSGWLWDGTSFDSVWGADTSPEVISVDSVISGWRDAIVGKPIGSRVVIVVPPAQGYGGAGQGSIPPDSTLVFLVDILAAY